MSPSKLYCLACSKRFSTFRSLHRHRKNTHGEKNHNCNQCNKSFRSPEQVKMHEKRVHMSQNFICQHCGKNFSSSSSLKEHETRHALVACSICKQTFESREIKNLHVKQAHPQKYPCDVCGKEYTRLNDAKRHKISSHKTCYCIICNDHFPGLKESHMRSRHPDVRSELNKRNK